MAGVFCTHCGVRFAPADQANEAGRRRCSACGANTYDSPRLLTLTALIAEDHVLLIQRGVAPYVGKWAPPGGYVERGESLEVAGAREVMEEVGIAIAPEDFLVTGVVSLPKLNQVHVVLLAMLDRFVEPCPVAPEALDARWFSAETLPRSDFWDPLRTFDIDAFLSQIAKRRYRFLQQSNDVRRVIWTESGLSHPWEKVPRV